MLRQLFSGCGEHGLLSTGVRLPLWRLFVLRSRASRARILSSCGSWLCSTGSAVVAHGLSCSTARGIFPGQGLSPRLRQWQADALPLSHQGSPLSFTPLSELYLQNLSSQLLSHVTKSFVTPWTVAHQAPLSMGFPRQEYRSCHSFSRESSQPRDQTTSPVSPALQADSLPLSQLGSSSNILTWKLALLCLTYRFLVFPSNLHSSNNPP